MELQIYKKDGLGEIRVQKDEADEAWFCAKDLCKALGYKRTQEAIRQHVDEDEVSKRHLIDKLGRKQQASYVNESGMYALIFGSKKENARAFRKWVTKEVLPSLRKTGRYETVKDSEEVRRLLSSQKEMENRIRRLEEDRSFHIEMIADYRGMLREQRVNLILEKHHEILGNENIMVRDMARILRELGHDISDNGLYEWMRTWSFLGSWGDEYNLPMPGIIEGGIFKVSWRRYRGSVYRVALLTPKGQRRVIEMFDEMPPIVV